MNITFATIMFSESPYKCPVPVLNSPDDGYVCSRHHGIKKLNAR